MILPMTEKHRQTVLDMMRVFYRSDAVYTNGSEEIFAADVDTCISQSPYLEGYVFAEGDAIVGYAMVAKSFSTEFGKMCMWIEDLYLQPDYRHQGYGTAFFAFLAEKYPQAIQRLEVEPENENAVALYKKAGFSVLPYTEMKK